MNIDLMQEPPSGKYISENHDRLKSRLTGIKLIYLAVMAVSAIALWMINPQLAAMRMFVIWIALTILTSIASLPLVKKKERLDAVESERGISLAEKLAGENPIIRRYHDIAIQDRGYIIKAELAAYRALQIVKPVFKD